MTQPLVFVTGTAGFIERRLNPDLTATVFARFESKAPENMRGTPAAALLASGKGG